MSCPRITALESAFVAGHWSGLFISVWRAPLSADAVEEWGRQRGHMAARHPEGFLSLMILEASVPMPHPAARHALAAAIVRFSESTRATAAVQEGTGFGAAALRSVLLSLSNETDVPYPRRIFGSAGEAAIWLAPHFARGAAPVSSAQITAAIDELRAMCRAERASPRVRLAG